MRRVPCRTSSIEPRWCRLPLLPPPWVQNRVQHKADRWYRCAFPSRRGSGRACRASSFSPQGPVLDILAAPGTFLSGSQTGVEKSCTWRGLARHRRISTSVGPGPAYTSNLPSRVPRRSCAWAGCPPFENHKRVGQPADRAEVGASRIKFFMSRTIHLVNSARLEISDVRSLCALCGQFVDVSLRCDSPLPENATEDRSKVTCRSCLRLMRPPSPYDRAELRRKVSNAPDFGETWEAREAIAEKTAKIDFGCNFKGNTCRAMRENRRGCCCQSCRSRHGFLETIKPSAFDEILPLFDRVWGFGVPEKGAYCRESGKARPVCFSPAFHL